MIKTEEEDADGKAFAQRTEICRTPVLQLRLQIAWARMCKNPCTMARWSIWVAQIMDCRIADNI